MDDIAEQLRQAKTSKAKERLQVLYWLKQENAPSINAIAKAVGKHRNTVQTLLSKYREGAIEAIPEVKQRSWGCASDSAVGRSGFSQATTRGEPQV